MKTSYILLIILLALIAGFSGAKLAGKSGDTQTVKTETAYQRVIRTGVIKCGYSVFAPYFTKDPVSGAYGGLWYEQTEAIAKHLGLKVEWAEEIGIANVAAALDSNRVDAYCSGLWAAGERVRSVDLLDPTAFEPMFVYVRTDDHRFDDDIKPVNQPSVRISTMDGEGGSLIAAEDFPNSTLVSLPQTATYADMFNQVVQNKADLVIAAPAGAAAFLQNNPGTIHAISKFPLRVFGCGISIKYGETDLRNMLNRAQRNLIDNGQIEKILAKGEVNPGDFWPPNKSYGENPK